MLNLNNSQSFVLLSHVPRKMVHEFTILSVVRGYHKYKYVWSTPIDGTELSCDREPGNQRDAVHWL